MTGATVRERATVAMLAEVLIEQAAHHDGLRLAHELTAVEAEHAGRPALAADAWAASNYHEGARDLAAVLGGRLTAWVAEDEATPSG